MTPEEMDTKNYGKSDKQVWSHENRHLAMKIWP